VRTLIEGNPGRAFKYFGELRAEGITPEVARLLSDAGFEEVEVGLQSVEPAAMDRMARKNNLKAFERGVRALINAGIKVTVDLIVGLPGDTPDSVRRGLRYLSDGGLYSRVQVFNLAVLPGTAFRHEAVELGLVYQPRPPYYVLRTPNMNRTDLYGLMQEAQDQFDVEFDAPPPLALDFDPRDAHRLWQVDLDRGPGRPPSPAIRAQAFTLWLRAADFREHAGRAVDLVRELLADNPFTTLQVVLEPTVTSAALIHQGLPSAIPSDLLSACLKCPTYLDRFYALQPGRPNGAKRLVLLLPHRLRSECHRAWLAEIGETASVTWHGLGPASSVSTFEPFEYATGEARIPLHC
jgi:hypothetical protein